ncbi:MAG: hypothetical protein QM783_01235 [Phycisphaerales bacterium]
MTRAATAILTLTLAAGAAHAQNALGGGRALDSGLSSQPGGRVNSSNSDYQSIVRFNTNAGNALNGPGIDINSLNARSRLVTSPNRPYVRIPSMDRTFSDTTYTNRLSNAGMQSGAAPTQYASTGYGSLGSPLGSRPNTIVDRVATLEAGYLPNGALTSNVTLPQGTTADDYRRTSDPYVGMVYDNRGNPVLARASSLRGITFAPQSAPPTVSAVGDESKVGSAVVYNRVIDELRCATMANPTNPNKVDLATNTTPGANTNTTPTKPTDTTNTTNPTNPANPANPANPQRPIGANPGTSLTQAPDDANRNETPATIKRLRDRLAPPPDAPTPNRPTALTADPSNAAATPSLTEEDIAALKQMSLTLDSLVPAGTTDAKATDAYTRMGQEALAAGHYGLADQMFQSAIARSADNTLAVAGRVNAVMGLGMVMTGGNDLRDFYVDHPEMIPVRFEAALLMPRGRADQLVKMLEEDIDRADGSMLPNSGLTLAYLGRQFENKAWLTKGLTAMAKQTKDDPQGRVLLEILQKVWTNGAPAPAPAAPASASTPAPAPATK